MNSLLFGWGGWRKRGADGKSNVRVDMAKLSVPLYYRAHGSA